MVAPLKRQIIVETIIHYTKINLLTTYLCAESIDLTKTVIILHYLAQLSMHDWLLILRCINTRRS